MEVEDRKDAVHLQYIFNSEEKAPILMNDPRTWVYKKEEPPRHKPISNAILPPLRCKQCNKEDFSLRYGPHPDLRWGPRPSSDYCRDCLIDKGFIESSAWSKKQTYEFVVPEVPKTKSMPAAKRARTTVSK